MSEFMKALFILARTGHERPPDGRAGAPPPSPTLIRLAALTPPWCEVTIINEATQPPAKSGEYDIVGVSCTAASASRAYNLTRTWSRRGAYTLLGGAHPTLVPDEAALYADTVVVGHAEDCLPQFWADIEVGEPKQRYDSAPEPVLPPIDDVVAWLADAGQPVVLPKAWVNSDREYALALFEALAPLELTWLATASLDWADDPELIAAAVRSGCQELRINFETTIAVAQYRDSVSCLRAHGIRVTGDFTVGNDDDTEESLAGVTEGIDQLGVDLPRFTLTTPFPGTPLHRRLSRQDRILTDDLDLYDERHVVFEPLNMTATHLQNEFVRLWRDAYSYPRMVRRSGSRQAWSDNLRLRRHGRLLLAK